MMRREFEPVVREELLDGNASVLEPLVCPPHEVCKSLGSFVGEYFGIRDSRGIVDHSSPVFFLLRIFSFDVLLLMHVDVH